MSKQQITAARDHDRDYDHAVEQIRNALHAPNGSRATVMVGSGFSFNAEKRHSSARDFPSWVGLAESLVERLYPTDEKGRERALRNAGATSGVLRLAQEFQAAFGRTALRNHVRDILPDLEHEPGLLHQELLTLPWADVFTTNYDTLLERAALPLREQRYEVVRCVSDLPLKRDPRIVKLHGTLPSLTECILTEEDYRKYPERFGPFVAEVQVAMVKSHLCLVGFSGDDPNFLAWAGWVRDRMGGQTLPIYLWTFDPPTIFQTRLLEERSIFPLPLYAITGEKRRESALRAFLERLKKPLGSPLPKWCLRRYPTNQETVKEPDPSGHQTSAEEWWKAALSWREHRKSYPGWMIPHVKAIESLWTNTEYWENSATINPTELLSLDAPTCVIVLFELLWRIRKAILPVEDALAHDTWGQALQCFAEWRKEQHVRPIFVGIGESTIEVDIAELDSAVMELHLERLRHAREIGKFDRFDRTLAEINASKSKEAISREQRDRIQHFTTHQKALKVLSAWDDGKLLVLLEEWDTASAPEWALRRAGLMIEVGRENAAKKILDQTLKNLRAMGDKGTPETWSIESWVTYILQSLEEMRSFQSVWASIDNKVERMIDSSANSSERYGTKSYKRSEYSEPSTGKRTGPAGTPPDLKETLSWLRDRSCDPEEILDWIGEKSSFEFTRSESESQTHAFESRSWTTQRAFFSSDSDKRRIAVYRALRLVEDAGLPLCSPDFRFIAYSLFEKAIAFLAEYDEAEAMGAVLRTRSDKLIKKWFTRQRVAVFPAAEIQRLHSIADASFRQLCEQPETPDRNAHERCRFEAACELLSRVAIRADDRTLQGLLRFTIALPARLQISERWWLADDLAVLVRRVCDGLSTSASWEILPDLMKTPVPGSLEFTELPEHSRWRDPVDLWGRRDAPQPETPSAELSGQIDATIERLEQTGEDAIAKSERRYLILRLATLVVRGLLDPKQQQRFAESLYARPDPETGFPVDTGCWDSLVLLAPSVDGVNEHQLFSDEYATKPWPTDFNKLLDLLSSLARTGPVTAYSGCRLREVNWTPGELREIAKRCGSVTKQWGDKLLSERGGSVDPPTTRMWDLTDENRARHVVERVAEVIDDVLLEREEMPAGLWAEITAAVNSADQVGLPMLRTYPKLASFERSFIHTLEEKIATRLSSDDEDEITSGFTALNHWANQLGDSRIPRIPDMMIAAAIGRLYGANPLGLIHVLDTISNLFDRLPANQSKRLHERCELPLRNWSHRFSYEAFRRGQERDRRLRQELPDLRAAMTRLCVTAEKHGLSSDAITNWLEDVREDPMPEVRRALEERSR